MERSCTKDDKLVKCDESQKEQLLEALGIDFKTAVTQGVREYLAEGTRLLINLLMESEVNEICGKRYSRNGSRKPLRWGNEQGTAIVGGTKEVIERPRVRKGVRGKGQEVQLETYQAFNDKEVLGENILASILAGVSTRRYAGTVEKQLRKHGISKSSVSRNAIEATKPIVDAFLARPLEELHLIALFIDGIKIGQCQVIVCIGVGSGGRKHVVGIRTGATENEVVCRDLLRDLKQRGLKQTQRYLFVIDGSAALATAIRAAFGNETPIQRCHEHKTRDVEAYLPIKQRKTYRARLKAAWNEKTAKEALERLTEIQSELKGISEAASNSLTEGMWDTLTLHRLGITGELRESLRTTNVIESAFSAVRRLTAKPTRYRTEADIVRWLAMGLHECEKHFRLVRGSRQLTELRKSLEGRRDLPQAKNSEGTKSC